MLPLRGKRQKLQMHRFAFGKYWNLPQCFSVRPDAHDFKLSAVRPGMIPRFPSAYNDGKPGISRDELITATFGDQYFGLARIALDFLAQPVDMGFKGMGGNTGVISPDIVKQHVPADDLLA